MMRTILATMVVMLVALFCATEARADAFDVCSITDIGPVGTPPTDRPYAPKYKQRGNDVAKWQHVMRFLGYSEVGAVDGVWGPKAKRGNNRFYKDHFSGVEHGSYMGPAARAKAVELIQAACAKQAAPPVKKQKAQRRDSSETVQTVPADTSVETVELAPVSTTVPPKKEAPTSTSESVATSSSSSQPTLSVYVNGEPTIPHMRVSAKTARFIAGGVLREPHIVLEFRATGQRDLSCLRDPTCVLNQLQRAKIASYSIRNCTGSGCAPLAVEHAIVTDIVALGATCTGRELLSVYRKYGQSAVRLDLTVGCAKEVISHAYSRAADSLSRSLETTST